MPSQLGPNGQLPQLQARLAAPAAEVRCSRHLPRAAGTTDSALLQSPGDATEPKAKHREEHFNPSPSPHTHAQTRLLPAPDVSLAGLQPSATACGTGLPRAGFCTQTDLVPTSKTGGSGWQGPAQPQASSLQVLHLQNNCGLEIYDRPVSQTMTQAGRSFLQLGGGGKGQDALHHLLLPAMAQMRTCSRGWSVTLASRSPPEMQGQGLETCFLPLNY